MYDASHIISLLRKHLFSMSICAERDIRIFIVEKFRAQGVQKSNDTANHRQQEEEKTEYTKNEEKTPGKQHDSNKSANSNINGQTEFKQYKMRHPGDMK